MKKYNVIYSPEAVSDLRSIYTYIAFTLQEPDTAENLVNEIRAEIRKLDQQPNGMLLLTGSRGRVWVCENYP